MDCRLQISWIGRKSMGLFGPLSVSRRNPRQGIVRVVGLFGPRTFAVEISEPSSSLPLFAALAVALISAHCPPKQFCGARSTALLTFSFVTPPEFLPTASSHGHSKSTCKPTAPPNQPGAPRCKPPARAGRKTRLVTGAKSPAPESAKTRANRLGSPASKPGTRRFQAQDGEHRPVKSASAIAVPRAEKTLSYK